MRQPAILGAFLGLLFLPPAKAQNPDDIEFRIRFVRSSAAFHAGEPMDLEISHASSAEKKYRGNWSALHRFYGNVSLRITPMDGVVDLMDLILGWGGSFFGSQGYVTEKPYIQQIDVNDWYRCRKPGHYSLMATSTAVSRIKSADEGGGVERLTLESNTLDFEILPTDPSWNAAELAEIEEILGQSEDRRERNAAVHRLTILDTPEAVRKLVELYLESGPSGDPSGMIQPGVSYSSRVDQVIGLIESSLSDPVRNPSGLGTDLLADFQVRKEFGSPPHRPDDPEGQKQWDKKMQERNEARSRYFAKANGLLLASLKQRTGQARVATIYEAWSNAERQNSGKPGSAESLRELRAEVLKLAPELTVEQQNNFLSMEWSQLPHEELRPIVERLATNSGEDLFSVRDQAYKFWCEDWLKECSASILAQVLRGGAPSKIGQYTILLLQESEHPELDGLIEKQLTEESNTPMDSAAFQRVKALALRAGSRNVRPAVENYLTRIESKQGYGCEGDLIGYLFRFDAEDAAKRLLKLLLNEKSSCAGGALQRLSQVRYTDELIPVATKGLDSGNLGTAGWAALFLGAHGAASSQEALRRRLDVLHERWRERAGELRAAETAIEGTEILRQTAALEQSLVSALVTAANWKSNAEERAELRSSCLTDRCRDIADGKMSLGF